ncbi:MAG: STAS domain-containing protein [Planctomycetota bacterium]
MSVCTATDGTLVTLLPEGSLDQELGEALAAAIEQALQEERSRFVVSLQKVPDANSVGLEQLVRLARRVADTGGRLALVGASTILADIFTATRLDRRLALFDSTEQALQTMRMGG